MSERRLCFLLVEKDTSGLSPRKVLIETARHNVFTAYSHDDAVATFDRFPDLDAIGLDSQFGDRECQKLASAMRSQNPRIKIVAFMGKGDEHTKWADFSVEADSPQELLELLVKLGGNTDLL